jgi:hypothetical protein
VKRTLLAALAGIVLVAGVSSCTAEDVSKEAIKQYFPDVYTKAVAVAKCESGLNPAAVSPGGSNVGLFQINKVHASMVRSMGHSWNEMTDPYVNAKVARRIYNSSGWRPWSCA